jgi:membrane protein insertase Oxa1/YidC/SpoIIIJ
MQGIWHDHLYTPLLNFLMFLYSGPAGMNLGIAIIQLTVLLRILLLPLSILDERNKFRYEKLDRQVEAIERDFKGDHVLRKEKIRGLLKEHKVNYWSKVLVLGFQLLVLILLYQVFVGGIRFTKQETLYAWVAAPVTAVNTTFLGYDLASHDWRWAAATALLLFTTIYLQQRQRAHLVSRSDVWFLILFPIFTYIILGMLPMVKSLFVLTSMLFTIVLGWVRRLFFKVPALKSLGTPS